MIPDYKFGLSPLTLTSLPRDTERLRTEVNKFVDSIAIDWKFEKSFQRPVTSKATKTQKIPETVKVDTYKTVTKDGTTWASRVSHHDAQEYTFASFAHYLVGATQSAKGESSSEWTIADISDHTRYESQFYEIVSGWERLDLANLSGSAEAFADGTSVLRDEFLHLKEWYAVQVEFDLGFPLKKREFNVLVHVTKPTLNHNGDLQFLVISFVLDHPETSKGKVQGRYTSFERVTYVKARNQIEWVMATCSDAGGMIPRWAQNMSICKALAPDVPCFLNWLNKH
ncbi:hypothetical protein BABINDRAFT_165178 [Babjeviella inositovora NRRL Y-12698]|uniref:DUF3074 domain-containing protein n=1 Tax=Babjeviella inositovora NRRL Y-12698 TaxID=984486 RepID=A0A1E3QVF6_9ASCO|nr:uncharacterized protein BABINDRAFT_165178 [Babjeviella inositovora NRRL Y-12698]ODQ81639.1 hypothetical protein BABINDRAFT_165178 [Babjeviella inositovora NRRL Y-12698]